MTCHMHNLDKQFILINVKKDEDKLEVLQLCDCIKIGLHMLQTYFIDAIVCHLQIHVPKFANHP